MMHALTIEKLHGVERGEGCTKSTLTIHNCSVLLTVLLLIGCSNASSSLVDSNNSTEARLGEVFQFDAVAGGTILKHRFVYTNLFSHAIKIASIDAGCDCTAVHPQVDIAAPGETVSIDATLDTTGKDGFVTAPFTCWLDSGERVEFRFRGFVSASVLKDVDFGRLKRGETITRKILVQEAPGTNLSIAELTYDHSKLQVIEGKPTDKELVYSVSLNPDVPYGEISETVVFTTSDQLNPIKTTTVRGYVRPAIELEPKKLGLGMLEPDVVATASCVVYSAYDKPFNIRRISQLEGYPLEWKRDESAAAAQKVIVSATGDDGEGPVTGRLLIEAELEGEVYPFELMVYALR